MASTSTSLTINKNTKLKKNNICTEKPKRNERLICGKIYLIGEKEYDHKYSRKYLKIDNAIIGLTKWLISNGTAGDFCIIYHEITCLEIGTLKMTERGVIYTKFIYD